MKIDPIDRWDATIVAMGGAGSVLAGIGVLKIAAHVSPLLSLNAALCGASGPVPLLDTMLADGLHCWGCPVAFAGSLLALAAVALGRSGERAAPAGPACAAAR